MTKPILIIVLQILFLAIIASAATTMNEKHINHHKKEKLTHLRLYWHESVSGQNPSAVIIHKAVLNSSLFGSITIIDDALTLDVSRNSTVVGQAQGLYAGTAQGEISFLMMMNFSFTSGEYNGSTITILGRNPISLNVREMSVVGGSGVFRFARGYVEAQTKVLDGKTGILIVEYNCYVLHY